MPCPPCKIILNGSFMATLAPVLAAKWHVDQTEIGKSASLLGIAARAQTEMLAALKFTIAASDGEFDGCEQAQALVRWIRGEEPNVQLMDKWTKDLWSSIADLAAGKLPT